MCEKEEEAERGQEDGRGDPWHLEESLPDQSNHNVPERAGRASASRHVHLRPSSIRSHPAAVSHTSITEPLSQLALTHAPGGPGSHTFMETTATRSGSRGRGQGAGLGSRTRILWEQAPGSG